MDQAEARSKIFYYLRNKYSTLMLNCAKEGMTKFKGESCFHLYYALALMLNKRLEEAIHELNLITSENDIKLATVIALMYFNKMLRVTNKEIYQKLDGQMRENRRTASAVDFYYASYVLYSLNKSEKALDYLEKSLQLNPELSEASNLKGWILIEQKKKGRKLPNVGEIFEKVLERDSKNIDALLGLSETYLCYSNFEKAVSVINKAIVKFPSLDLPLVQKMKIQLAQQQWDQSNETLNRIVNTDSENIDALKICIIILLCYEANYEEAVSCIDRFLKILETVEPKNGNILLESAQLFSQICGKNDKILNLTCQMVEKAVKFDPENDEFVVELGYQYLLLNRTKDALKCFKMGTKVNDSCVHALIGITLIELIQNGTSEQVAKQVNYILDFQEAQSSTMLCLVQSKLSEDVNESLNYLRKASEICLNQIKHYPYSEQYLRNLKPEFMMEIVREILSYVPCAFDVSVQAPTTLANDMNSTIQNILTVISKACPGLHESMFLLAKLQYYLNGDVNSAISNLEQILTRPNMNLTEAYLLLAQIHAQNGNYERATQNLEVGLSHDFSVRENPIYHFIGGLIQKNLNNIQDAIKSFTTALSLINLHGSRNVFAKSDTDLNLSEKCSIYIELISCHNKIGQLAEALKTMEMATEELHGTSEQTRLVILSAEQEVARRNIQGALDLLAQIKPNQAYYPQAKTKFANIILEYRKDKKTFLECYKEMASQTPGAESYVLLGDAYMSVLEPDQAIDCYQKALAENPKNPELNLKMGKTYVYAHYFNKAIDFYKNAIQSTNYSALKLELSRLYMQMKQYNKAELLLVSEIEAEDNTLAEDLTYLQYKTKLLNLLALIQEKSGNVLGAVTTLKDVRDNQERVRKRLVLELTNIPHEETKLLVDINMKLAEMHIEMKDNEKAVQYYKAALEIAPSDINILTALAKVYMQMQHLELCQQACGNILKIDQENEAASVMMADIAFHKIDFDMALFHFTQLITKQPTNWKALERLIEILRRTGKLDEAQEYLTYAEQKCENPSKNSGFLYCTALYQWYSGNLNSALRNFNMTRQDSEWGQKSLYNMIEICLNPEDEMFTEKFIDGDDSIEYRDSRSMALKTAERLIRELKQKQDNRGDELLKVKLLSNFRLLATKEKYNLEQALEGFIQLASQPQHKENIGVILGMASAHTLLKQSQRAKNQLKRIVKTPWTYADAEYLERCWLLLADYYIQSSKYDVAADLLNKVTNYNKSCNKAYEYLGFLCEKEQRYKDAAFNYDLAWKYGGQNNPTVAYKLAHSLMKCKKYSDAYVVGQQLLKLSPDYPRVKREILDKSMNNLRT